MQSSPTDDSDVEAIVKSVLCGIALMINLYILMQLIRRLIFHIQPKINHNQNNLSHINSNNSPGAVNVDTGHGMNSNETSRAQTSTIATTVTPKPSKVSPNDTSKSPSKNSEEISKSSKSSNNSKSMKNSHRQRQTYEEENKLKKMAKSIKATSLLSVTFSTLHALVATSDYILIFFPVSFEPWYCNSVVILLGSCYAFGKISMYYFFMARLHSAFNKSMHAYPVSFKPLFFLF